MRVIPGGRDRGDGPSENPGGGSLSKKLSGWQAQEDRPWLDSLRRGHGAGQVCRAWRLDRSSIT